MLILVAVTVRTVVQSGLFGHAGKATSGYSMHEAREQLGTTLASAQAEKYTNKDYDEDVFLDEHIKSELPEAGISGDVVLVDGWAFEIDRTVPKIVKELGKGNPEDFIAPELTVTKGALAENKQSLKIMITAKESTNGINKIEIYKAGETTPLETFNYDNQLTTITEEYEVINNAKYIVKAYAKLSTTKSVMVTEFAPFTGAYVQYSPKPAEPYLIEAKYSGYTADQSISQDTDLKWRVMSLNSDGTIDLIADKTIKTQVFLYGILGVNNGVYFLNDLCKKQYSNPEYEAVGRSINLVDIEKHLTDSGKAVRDSFSYVANSVSYGNSKTYTSNFHTPHIYKNHDKNVTKVPNNIAQMESENFYTTPTTISSTQENDLTIIQTFYMINSNNSYYNDSNFPELIFGTGTNYWLASRFALDEVSRACFGLRYIRGNELYGYAPMASGGNMSLAGYVVRPVVSLSSDFRLQQVEGSTEWKIEKK